MKKAVQGYNICFVGAFRRLTRSFTGIIHFNLADQVENNVFYTFGRLCFSAS